VLLAVTLFGYRPELALAWILGTFFLFAFFRSIRANWPENYFAFDSSTDPIVSRSLLHYVSYRILPVYVTCLFAAVGLDRSGVPEWHSMPAAWRGIAGIVVGHVGMTNVRGVFAILRRRQRRVRDIGILSLQLGMVLMISAGGLLSLIGRTVLAPLVPRPQELSIALWTGLVVAAMGGWLIDATRGRDRPMSRLIRASSTTIDPSLLDFAKHRCLETETEWRLFYAVMIYENLQRPPWVRRIERSVARLRRQGTYGIMQVASEGVVTDRESIDIALERHLAGARVVPDEYSNFESIVANLASYSSDERYPHQVAAVYDELPDEII
jgi:hypothetical protein